MVWCLNCLLLSILTSIEPDHHIDIYSYMKYISSLPKAKTILSSFVFMIYLDAINHYDSFGNFIEHFTSYSRFPISNSTHGNFTITCPSFFSILNHLIYPKIIALISYINEQQQVPLTVSGTKGLPVSLS